MDVTKSKWYWGILIFFMILVINNWVNPDTEINLDTQEGRQLISTIRSMSYHQLVDEYGKPDWREGYLTRYNYGIWYNIKVKKSKVDIWCNLELSFDKDTYNVIDWELVHCK